MDQLYPAFLNLIGLTCGAGFLCLLALFFGVGVIARLRVEY